MTAVKSNCTDILTKGFELDQESIDEFVVKLLDDLYDYTGDFMRKLCRDLNTNLLRKFKNIFTKDDRGKPRNWRMLEEQQIKDLFDLKKH